MAYRQALPIRRFGCDTTSLLRNMTNRIDAKRRGATPDRRVPMPFVFENELPPLVSEVAGSSTEIFSPEPVFIRGEK
jgi:hypothetical protein